MGWPFRGPVADGRGGSGPSGRKDAARLAVAAGFLAAGLSPGGEELPEAWVELEARPETLFVHRARSSSDGLAHVCFRNLAGRAVTIARARAGYFQGERSLGAGEIASNLPEELSFLRLPLELAAGARSGWLAACLEGIPEGADRVRLEFDVRLRRGVRGAWRTVAVDIGLEEPPRVALRLPFEEGLWKVSQGHGCATQHRIGGRGQEFAWDFVALAAATGRERAWKNRDLPTFGKPVLAPISGRVVRVVADVTDNEGLRDYPRRSLLDDLARPDWVFGNHVILDAGGGIYVLLAHLQEASVRVAPGDFVQAGEPIARAGNSGNTVHPHVHLQAMDRPDPADPRVRGLPASFVDYRQFTIVPGRSYTDLYSQRVSVGDPPEGVVVAPASGERSAPLSPRSP
jgi:murein DD-endopeptidase MepM/ murein hydrolase activator NlpD